MEAAAAAVSLALSSLTEETLGVAAKKLQTLPPSAFATPLVACGSSMAADVHAQLAEELSACEGFLPQLRSALVAAFPSCRRGSTSLLEQLASRPGVRGVAADTLDDLSTASIGDEAFAELLVRVGPRLVASAPDAADAESTGLWLSSLAAGLVCAQRCGQGSLCAVCAAHASEAASWSSSVAPALACSENDEGVAATGLAKLTNALLLGGDLGAAAEQNSGRAGTRPLVVRGVQLSFAQRGSFDCGDEGGGGGATGMVLWGAAALLSWHLEYDASTCALLAAGSRVLELGAGLGSVSAAAAILGGRVVATDGDADVVSLAMQNLKAAAAAAGEAGIACAEVATARLRWGNEEDWAALVRSHGAVHDLVLACECTFFVEAHAELAGLLRRLAAGGASILLAHTWRRLTPERAFFARLAELGLASEDVTPKPESGAPQPGSTVLLRLTLAARGH